ncbi:hypothetical protein ACIBCU_34335 [Streptomyces sp. NPDC051064]|uniref:hypothetical protein n=1 Tax=Streptomyces sp. NPDC051064 TaxID=3365641 RepID=UPI003787AF94
MKKMVRYIIPIIAALIGGTAAFWLSTFRDRIRLDLNLISISKGRNPKEAAPIGDRIVEISGSFTLSGVDLGNDSTESDIALVCSDARDVQEGAPEQIRLARELKRRIWHCRTVEERVDFITELISDGGFIFREICAGIRKCELILPNAKGKETSEPSEPVLPSVKKEDTPEVQEVCSVETRELDGRECIVMEFQDRRYRIPVDSPTLKERMLPLAQAIKTFNKETLDKCLEYTISAIRQDHSRADILTSGLGEIMNSGPFRVDLMIVNKGSRAAVLSPYAALLTSGAISSLEALPLKIESIQDTRNEEAIQGSSFVSIEPNSTATLILRSDPIESSNALAAAYDKGILSCSIAIVRLKTTLTGKLAYKMQETVHKDFGANFDHNMRVQVMKLAKR